MKKNLHKALTNAFTLATVMAATGAWAQVALPASSPYSQNFDATPGASGTAYPTGWVAYNGSTLDNSMSVGNANSTAGANYNYGSKIGILGSGSAYGNSSIVLAVSNTAGKNALKISYTITKMREQARSNSFNLEISTTSANSGFSPVVGGEYASGSIAQGTVTAYNDIDISALDNNSGTVWIRWSYTELGGSGSRDGIALDDVSISWSSAPVLGVPVATDGTDVTYNSFVANWNAVEGAESYRLDVSTSSNFGAPAPATDLFFSEYVEGSASNKYLEIFNGTGADVNLSDYRVRLYANGATATTSDVQLSGMLANGATLVLKNNAATIYTGAATVSAAVNFNGDDAIALYKISTGANVDIFGSIGEDPGSAWTSGAYTTVDKTLVRKASVTGGVTVNPAEGFPTLETEWDIFDQNEIASLGNHTFGGSISSFVPGYENLTVSGTSAAVSGLEGSVSYYYRVRAVAGTYTTGNSNPIMVTTLEDTNPRLRATALENFGSLCAGESSEGQLVTITGSYVTPGTITIAALGGFSYSLTIDGTYENTLSFTTTEESFSQDVYVKFTPESALVYSTSFNVSGSDAAAITVAVNGTGVNTLATVATTTAAAVSAIAAEFTGTITDMGCSNSDDFGFILGTTPNPTFESGNFILADFDFENSTSEAFVSTVSGLTGGTTYYVRAYANNNGGIAYSADTVIVTNGVVAPIATDATGVTASGFTANWEVSEGAVSYRLDVSTSETFGTSAPASDLFFSEYVEGSSSNKYLEIFNGTGAPVDLSDYRVRLYSNGSEIASGNANDVQLSGILANGAVAVIKNNAATIYTGTATVVAAVNFNGNDAVALFKISTSANVDIFGRIGENPGSAWTGAESSTLDKTLVRKPFVSGGVTENPAEGFPTLETEWEVREQNDITNLGTHEFAGQTGSFVEGYENLIVTENFQEVTGLTEGVTYYYRVRAVAGNTSDNSDTITVGQSATQRMARKANNMAVYKQANVLTVTSQDSDIKSVAVFDINGKLLYNADNNNQKEVVIEGLSPAQQVLIIRAYTVNNELIVKKVVF